MVLYTVVCHVYRKNEFIFPFAVHESTHYLRSRSSVLEDYIFKKGKIKYMKLCISLRVTIGKW